jgi:hypothetical protein
MTQFQCRICNYKFESTKSPKRCPYCSRVGTAQPVPQASDILKEIEKQGEEAEE